MKAAQAPIASVAEIGSVTTTNPDRSVKSAAVTTMKRDDNLALSKIPCKDNDCQSVGVNSSANREVLLGHTRGTMPPPPTDAESTGNDGVILAPYPCPNNNKMKGATTMTNTPPSLPTLPTNLAIELLDDANEDKDGSDLKKNDIIFHPGINGEDGSVEWLGARRPLFKTTGRTAGPHWDYLRFIAPSSDKMNIDCHMGVICLKCKMHINYHRSKNSWAITRHLKKCHNGSSEQHTKDEEQKTIDKHCVTAGKIDQLRVASEDEQEELADFIAVLCATGCTRFKFLQDKHFQDLIDYVSLAHARLTVPSIPTVTEKIKIVNKDLKKQVLDDIKKNCSYYACTSDVWTSRTMKSFLALTVHYVTEDFQLRRFTLEVKQIFGSHTAKFIKEEWETSFDTWDLDKLNMTMMVGDNGSNMVKACKDWNIRHCPCLGHCIHLVVGPYLLIAKEPKGTRNNQVVTEDENEDDDGTTDDAEKAESVDGIDEKIEQDEQGYRYDFYEDLFSEEYQQKTNIKDVRLLVQKYRCLYFYFKNSAKGTEVLENLQKDPKAGLKMKVDVNVRARWSSTFEMLERIVLLQNPLREFLTYLKSPEGRKEYNKISVTNIDIDESDWAMIEGLRILLKPFALTSSKFSGQEYATLASAIPRIEILRAQMNSEFLFKKSDHMSGLKKEFFGNHETTPYFEAVYRKLIHCQNYFKGEYKRRFVVQKDLDWISFLDPNLKQIVPPNFEHTLWASDSDKEASKNLLKREVFCLAALKLGHDYEEAMEYFNASFMADAYYTDSSSCSNSVLDFFQAEYDCESDDEAKESKEDHLSNLKTVVSNEVDLYLLYIDLSSKVTDSLNWWRENRKTFPHVAQAARKWLSTPATSTLSERISSICEIVDDPMQSILLDESDTIEMQVFIHNNREVCSFIDA